MKPTLNVRNPLVSVALRCVVFFWCFGLVLTAQTKVAIDLGSLGQPSHRETFTEVKSIKLLPASVLKDLHGGMADPGGEFNAGDVVSPGDRKPSRRLVVAGVSEKYCLIHYERGGIAHLWLVALFKLANDKAALVFLSNSASKASLGELKAVVESGTLRDQGQHTYW